MYKNKKYIFKAYTIMVSMFLLPIIIKNNFWFLKNQIVFIVYIYVCVIINFIYINKINKAFTDYIKTQYGDWNELSKLLKNKYNIGYVPNSTSQTKYRWFAFSRYDFDDKQLIALKAIWRNMFIFAIVMIVSLMIILPFIVLL